LPAAIVPVAVGAATVVGDGVLWWRTLGALVVALAIQVGTNYANDYSDGVRGTDEDRVGPTRLVAGGLATPGEVKRAASAAFAVAGVVGTAVSVVVGPELFAVGVVSVLAGWFYTGGPRPYGYAGLGEVFVFVFFGLVATVGTAYVSIERVEGLAVVAAVPVGLWAVGILLANNLRDIPGDTVAGKRTLAVRLGDARTRRLFQLNLALSAVGVVVTATVGRPWAALGLVGFVVAVPVVRTVRSGAVGRELIPVLAGSARLQMVAGTAFAVGVALSG
jgi:1,4-dihydroxy-2-naphthoate octaprenyltransferase